MMVTNVIGIIKLIRVIATVLFIGYVGAAYAPIKDGERNKIIKTQNYLFLIIVICTAVIYLLPKFCS